MSDYLEIALNRTLHKNYHDYFKYFQSQDNIKDKPEASHQQILDTFRSMIEASMNLALKDKSICFDDNFLYRFLYARKFNCNAAMDLLINYLDNKKNNTFWQNINVFDQKIQYALLDGNPGILSERDRRGRQVITFTAANWNTSKYSLDDIYRALLLTLDVLLDDIQNQALGFVIIVDWTNFTYKQSTHLSPKILKYIIEGLQVHIYIFIYRLNTYKIFVNSDDVSFSDTIFFVYPKLDTFRSMIEASMNLALKDKSICFDDNFLYRFLYARKFNCNAAMDLLINYLDNKKNNTFWQNINVFDQKIQYALLDGNPGILSERDRRGRQVITFTAANWNTSKYSLDDIYRALLLTLDVLLDDIQNQALGFVIIVDWTNFTYKQSTHLSPKILKYIIEGLQEFMPVKFKGIHFIAQPWYVDFILTAIKPFFKDKIKKRIYVHGFNLSSMHNLVCKDILPPELGGDAPNVNHFDWFNSLIVCSQSSDIPKEYRIMKTIVYTKSPICLKEDNKTKN